MDEKNIKNYYLGEDYPGIYFTRREVDCLMCLLDSHTIVSAATILELSPRTVEFYVKNMRMKIGVKTKSDLLKKIRKMGFMNRRKMKPMQHDPLFGPEPESEPT